MTSWRGAVSSRTFMVLAVVAAGARIGNSPLYAVTPIVWSLQSAADFERGKPDGVSVGARGGIQLARNVREVSVKALEEDAQPFLWTEAVDSRGNLYVGSGNDGRIFKVSREGEGSLFYSTGELAVQALAVDSHDNVYAGTSPEGKVYRLTPDGKSEIWFDPDERYIWALAADRSGNLYVATGEHGIVYRVTDKGKGASFFDSEESHIVSLALDSKGNLLAGSSGKGLLYRIAPDGKGQVLLDTAMKEVNALAVDSGGRVFASAIQADTALPRATPAGRRTASGGPTPIPSAVPTPVEEPSLTEMEEEDMGSEGGVLSTAGSASRRARSEIYRIDSDGTATSIWSSESETVFSLAATGENEIYMGTGDLGKIRRTDAEGNSSLVAKLTSSQVTALCAAPDGTLFASTSNAGRIFALGKDTGESGTYLSPPRDALTVARWGRIGWIGSSSEGAKMEVFTRSGNSAIPDSTWSDWSPAYGAATGSGVVSPAARFIQWKARLARSSRGPSPILESLSLTYLPSNLPPRVEKAEVNPRGVVIVKPPPPAELEIMEGAFSAPPALPEGTELASPFPLLPGKKIFQKGMRSLSWTGADPNSDTLRYDLYFRGDGETEWKPMVRGLREAYFAWDSSLLPDGRYRIRIVASDAPSNPPGGEKTGETVTLPFVVDNSPPRVEVGGKKKEDKSGGTVEAKVTDSTSAVRSLEYSLDGGRWILLMPVDGIADSLSEQYRIPLERMPAGGHTLLLKATDVEGNVGTEKVVLSGG